MQPYCLSLCFDTVLCHLFCDFFSTVEFLKTTTKSGGKPLKTSSVRMFFPYLFLPPYAPARPGGTTQGRLEVPGAGRDPLEQPSLVPSASAGGGGAGGEPPRSSPMLMVVVCEGGCAAF